MRWVADVRDDADHPARAALDAVLTRLAYDLQHDPLTRQRAETVKERLLRSARTCPPPSARCGPRCAGSSSRPWTTPTASCGSGRSRR